MITGEKISGGWGKTYCRSPFVYTLLEYEPRRDKVKFEREQEWLEGPMV